MTNVLHMPTVMIPDLGDNKKTGLSVFWRLTGTLAKTTVDEALAKVLPNHVKPAASNDQKYLRRAMDAIRGGASHSLVRKMEGLGGFSLVNENASELDLEAAELKGRKADAFDVSLNATVVKDAFGNSTVKVTPANHPQANMLKAQFIVQQNLYHCGLDISSFLTTKVMKLVNAVSMRDRGGIYLVGPNEDSLRTKQIIEALHSVSTFDANGKLLNGFKGYAVPVIFSEDLVDVVTDSLDEEIESLISNVMDKLNDDNLGMKGYQGQRRIVLETYSKVEKFAKALGVSMGNLTEKLDDLTNTLGAAEARLQYETDHPEE